VNGSRCEATCQSRQVAHCVKSSNGRRPSCYCQ
jgi:hypothetical protein